MVNNRFEYDAIVVGSGPNGLAAAITMQQQGLSTLIVEGSKAIGGGLRSAEVTLPGFLHDICSAVHPMAVSSPFFKQMPLAKHGLDFIYPEVAAAHPLDNGSSAALYRSIQKTAVTLGADADAYTRIYEPLAKYWPSIAVDVLGPLRIPKHPLNMVRFGLMGLTSAKSFADNFKTKEARGLWAGMAAHSIQPLSSLTTSAIGLVLTVAGHLYGWPIPKGGSQSIANSLVSYYTSIGGKIQTDFYVNALSELPPSRAVLFDVTPKQLLKIAGHKFSPLYKWQLQRFKYGMGVFKVDWALNEPIPFTNPDCRKAGTVHIGNTFEEIASSEYLSSTGKHPEKPFVLLAQQSLFDATRAPEGKHTAWAYCHVPNGSLKDMTDAIENQIARFAPGFKDIILAKATSNTAQIEEYNNNYLGGDINGGKLDITQLFTRPALRMSPYKTSHQGLYICSSSTPPGGGVHGMCGYYAAKRALSDIFNIKLPSL
ncbi:NAD(P)/FAD-dependent oxidoreductase [Mucilaginibacter sp. Bleaf8]|uniref:phytoene desaturase family protein n=1 Tax=Mucilaginibacter sp. Bleaf8 TaxID=2834430 RepID=UPI001BCE9401|nr:NAD(P)/FAD-dependent oxidoreductase [Mucilaginibacter sp. Bleaf8]MBS7562846.1 NAD(P)/FAD-dependent oxidoreductase [Mucilaginibacter sp. Bleaf8]